jgi:REP element-mobilizing transposase RayT
VILRRAPDPGDRWSAHDSSESMHHAFGLFAHLTWHTWRRIASIDRSVAADVEAAFEHGCAICGVQILRRAIVVDQVHLLLSFRPDSVLSDFVRIAKSMSAVRVNRRIPRGLRWARGFYVRSLSKSELPVVSRYIARQELLRPGLIPRARHPFHR